MDENDLQCLRCGGLMQQGFVPDRAQGAVLVGTWVEGEPEHSWWTGIKTSDKPQYAITVFRCESCGYLESYAKVRSFY